MFDVRPLPEDQIDAAIEVGSLAYHLRAFEPQELDRRRAFLAATHRLGAYDGDRLGGVASALDFDLSIPGGSLPAFGVTWVAVRPDRRRRGALSKMMRRQLADAHALGVPLAVLWAAEGAIYGRYGYGVAIRALGLEADARLALRGDPDAAPVEVVLPGDVDAAIAAVGPVHERERARRPGMVARGDAAWRDLLLHGGPGAPVPGASDPRVAVVGEPATGYAVYRQRGGPDIDAPAQIVVTELVADDVAGAAALWRFLTSIDLIDRVTARNLPVDDPLPLIAADPDRVRVRAVDTGNWLRLVDLPAALKARAGGADVTALVHDDVLPDNDGTWHLGSGEPAPRPDLELQTRDLAAAYLGGTPVAALHRAGLVTEHTPGAAARLDAAWRTELAPYGPDDY